MLVTADRQEGGPPKPGPRVRPVRPRVWIGEAYTEAVAAAGGLPLVVRPGETDFDALLYLADAVVITGGAFDIHPRWYGQEPTGRLDRVDEARTSTEIGLARACLQRRVPILGVCGGMQALAVAAGGSLVQDLPPGDDLHLAHEQPTDPATPWHPVRVGPPADAWLGVLVDVNSTHHQAVATTGTLVPCGWASDGVIEVVASTSHPFALGVQWHPEVLGDLRPYKALLAAVTG